MSPFLVDSFVETGHEPVRPERVGRGKSKQSAAKWAWKLRENPCQTTHSLLGLDAEKGNPVA